MLRHNRYISVQVRKSNPALARLAFRLSSQHHLCDKSWPSPLNSKTTSRGWIQISSVGNQ
jgi:hypothetical protein